MKTPLIEYCGLIPPIGGGGETSSSANDGSLWVPLGRDRSLDKISGGTMKRPLLSSDGNKEQDEPKEWP